MEYRKLLRGNDNENFSVLGLGMAALHNNSDEEIEAVIRLAIENGINYFDLCCNSRSLLPPFGRAIAPVREKVFLQMHFGAVFNENGEYGWSRDFEEITRTVKEEMELAGLDYIDFGMLHCVDQEEDYEELVKIGVLDHIKELKAKGIVRHIGLSSHTPAVIEHILDTGLIDMVMFSTNPAYDYEKGDEYGIGTLSERKHLFARCEKEGIGISVMKPFNGGQLLDASISPFHQSMSHYQCLQYAIDRPGVITTVPGIRGMQDLKDLLGFFDAPAEEKDYSMLADFTPDNTANRCVYCSHCHPCPAGIDIVLVNKYYDLARNGDPLAVGHYEKLAVKADACLDCGHCDRRCPFQVKQSQRMKEIRAYFEKQ